MPKYIIYPNPNKKTVIRYERKIENLVNGKLEDDYLEDQTLSRAPLTKVTWSVAQKAQGGNLNTGLLNLVDNPYKDEEDYKTPEWENILKGKTKITIQEKLEYKHNRSPGFYTNEIQGRVLDRQHDPDKENFFQSRIAQLNFHDGATILDTDNNPIHEVLYYGLLASKLIANSYRELESYTPFYIAKEHEETERKAENSKRKNSCIAKLEEIASKSHGLTIKFCKALNKPSTRKVNLTEDQAYTSLSSFINSATAHELEEFVAVYKMWNDTETRSRFEAYATLSDCMDLGIIWSKGNEYLWQPPMSEDGKTELPKKFSRESQVIEFLTSPKYQEEQELVEKQIIAKRRF